MRALRTIPVVLGAVMALVCNSASAQTDVTQAECSEMNGKAQDLRRDGKLSAAREQLRKCSDPSCPAAIRDDCAKRLDEVERMQPTIVFEAKDASGKDLTAVVVSMDGVRLADSLDGTALAVDPGAHTFTFEVSGQSPIVQQYVLREGERARTALIVSGTPAPVRSPTPPEPSATNAPPAINAAAAPPTPKPDFQTSADAGEVQRAIGLVSVGLGAAGLLVGGVFGALSIAAHNDYERNCGSNIGAPPAQCNLAGVSGQSDAADKGTVSTGFIVGGAVLAGAGAVLFFTAPKRAPMQVGAVPNGVLLRGYW
jgi:hypothetical protein